MRHRFVSGAYRVWCDGFFPIGRLGVPGDGCSVDRHHHGESVRQNESEILADLSTGTGSDLFPRDRQHTGPKRERGKTLFPRWRFGLVSKIRFEQVIRAQTLSAQPIS